MPPCGGNVRRAQHGVMNHDTVHDSRYSPGVVLILVLSIKPRKIPLLSYGTVYCFPDQTAAIAWPSIPNRALIQPRTTILHYAPMPTSEERGR